MSNPTKLSETGDQLADLATAVEASKDRLIAHLVGMVGEMKAVSELIARHADELPDDFVAALQPVFVSFGKKLLAYQEERAKHRHLDGFLGEAIGVHEANMADYARWMRDELASLRPPDAAKPDSSS